MNQSACRLSPTSYVVLGLIALRGPSTPYDLKRATARSVAYFWSFPHSQLYSEPDRLAQAGFLDLEVETEGRSRKVYSLTDAGRTALNDWVLTPPDAMFELRDTALLKLFFSELANGENLVSMAEHQLAQHRARLEIYEGIYHHYEGRADRQIRRAPLQFGVLLEKAYIEFWTGIAENPPGDDTEDGAAG